MLLRMRGAGAGAREVVVYPISMQQGFNLRYSEWQYSRRLIVDSLRRAASATCICAMVGGNMSEFVRGSIGVFNRDGAHH